MVIGTEFLKSILTYLYFTKYNKINIGHSDMQKHFLLNYGINNINILYSKFKQKISDPLQPTEGENF